MIKEELIGKYAGSLLGLAIGDAIGSSVEFMRPGSFTPINDMIGGGHYNLNLGEWTDDTSMALCLADSLISKQGFDPYDQLTRYIKWMDEGYFSSRKKSFGIGRTTMQALESFKRFPKPYCGLKKSDSSGNGSLMRLAPVPLAYAKNPEYAIKMSGKSSRTTHQTVVCIQSCEYFGGLIVGALYNESKDFLLSTDYIKKYPYLEKRRIIDELNNVIKGSFKNKNPPEIESTGYVIKSLESALWAFYNSESFDDGLIKVINLGNDSDTAGAIFGQLAGAYYGKENIPQKWVDLLKYSKLICNMAERLYDLSEHIKFGSVNLTKDL